MTELANGRDAPESDSEFDVRHGTDTAGSVEPGDLGIGNTESRKRRPARRAFPSSAVPIDDRGSNLENTTTRRDGS
jgi:hypothetical protein